MRAAAPVRSLRLGNGLTVLLREMRQVPLVSVWCWYRVGSQDERPGITGISHWVEHMNFKGTRRIPKSDVTRLTELAGGTWNGYTWLDVTTYFETVRRDALETMLRLEASRMSECLYSPAEVERERTVVISELQGGENDPRTYLEREVSGTALQAHPYRWPTIGYLSDLRAITREDLYSHYRTYYVPNNAILALAGDFDTREALRLVRRHFGSIRRGGAPPSVRTIEPPQSGERRVVVRRPSGAAYLHLAFPAPQVTDPSFAPMLVADGLLAGGPSVNVWSGHAGRGPAKSSRLYRALVEGDLASEVETSIVPTRHPYLYRIQATASEGVDPGRIETAVLAEIERLARGEMTPHDLEKSKNQILARYALESESVTDVAHQLGFFETISSHRVWLDLPRRVAAVSADEVARVARDRLNDLNRTIGVLLPTAEEKRP
ncbi:MAG TPA: pitrilysin family protein [Candidatus Polarisedimenticolia bacterium]|nr:pitrilysin family protein [Candidatus Polarisedimenticolia bacterium]